MLDLVEQFKANEKKFKAGSNISPMSADPQKRQVKNKLIARKTRRIMK